MSDNYGDKILIFPLWFLMTIGGILHIYYFIEWQFFNNTNGISTFYTSRFNTSLEAHKWIISQLGIVGTILLLTLIVLYFIVTCQLFSNKTKP